MEEREPIMEELNLESCPFCGGEAVDGFSVWDGFFIYCTNCGGQSGYADTLAQAADKWNRRANDSDVESCRKSAEDTERAYKSILESEANDLELIASGLDRLKKNDECEEEQ